MHQAAATPNTRFSGTAMAAISVSRMAAPGVGRAGRQVAPPLRKRLGETAASGSTKTAA